MKKVIFIIALVGMMTGCGEVTETEIKAQQMIDKVVQNFYDKHGLGTTYSLDCKDGFLIESHLYPVTGHVHETIIEDENEVPIRCGDVNRLEVVGIPADADTVSVIVQ